MKQILVAEDDKIIREMYQEFLEEEGFQVHAAINGSKALDYLSQNPDAVDLILTDYEMPVMDGLELTKKARENGFKGPIVLSSGTLMEEVALQAGADRFLQKPPRLEQFLNTIAELLK